MVLSMAFLVPGYGSREPGDAEHPAVAIGEEFEQVDVRIVDSYLPVAELLEALADCEVISAFNGVWTAPRPVDWPMPPPIELAEALPKLQLVQMSSAGYNAIPIAELDRLGVRVANNGGSNAISVAEHTVMLILSLQRNLLAMHNSVQGGSWADLSPSDRATPGMELAGQTLGIIGFGNIGRQVARKLGGFDMNILYHDAVRLPPGRDGELGVRQVTLEELLAQSDIITVHVPLLPSTEGLIGPAELSQMKRGVCFINTSRGPTVDEAALAAALDSGQVGAAGIGRQTLLPLLCASDRC